MSLGQQELTSKARRRRHYQLRAERVNQIKLAAGCKDCGYAEHPAALDFDHRPDEVKLFAIGGSTRRSWENVKLEMAKCDIVCANCHRIRTFERNQDV